MAATAADFPNTSWKNYSEPVSSAAGEGKIGFSGAPVGSVAGAFDLNNLTRLAGSLGSLFGSGSNSIEDYIKQATKTLKQEQRRTTKKINTRIENIYPELTGMTGEEALNKYYDAFANTVADVTAQGRADLGVTPDISAEYDRLNNRVQNIQNQYSLAGRLGGYEKLALDPPVVSMDAASIRNVADWVDPTSNQIKSKYKAMYDYQDPQSQQFIYGSRNTADAIGRYYNTSGDVSGLMNYGGLG
jgi:hypothetical protein